MKRLIVCCDGTWQELTSPYPTNVVKIAQALEPNSLDRTPQILFYIEGLGTEPDKKLTGGAFGAGIDKNIMDGYMFLSLNYSEGDEIYLFGFSRGAYTARSLGGLIYISGLVRRECIRSIPQAYNLYRDESHPDDKPAVEFRKNYSTRINEGDRPKITALCCWDTVGSLGIPNEIPFLSEIVNEKYKFHDTKLSWIIKNAFHAVAIDELREVFNVTLMDKSATAEEQNINLRQMWFSGDHGCIGGGDNQKRELSDITLKWMIEQIRSSNLKLLLNEKKIADGIVENYCAPFDNEVKGIYGLSGKINRPIVGTFDDISISAKRRWKYVPNYRPENLKDRFITELSAWNDPA